MSEENEMTQRRHRLIAELAAVQRERDKALGRSHVLQQAAIEAAELFRRYAEHHRAKGDEEKARRNEHAAAKLWQAIQGHG